MPRGAISTMDELMVKLSDQKKVSSRCQKTIRDLRKSMAKLSDQEKVSSRCRKTMRDLRKYIGKQTLRLQTLRRVVTSLKEEKAALVRVLVMQQRQEDMLIFRPLQRLPYTTGERKGSALLLQSLQGEALDWGAIEKEFMPSGRCAFCSPIKYKNQYCLSP